MDLWSIGGGGGVKLPWVYVHCTIYELIWCNGFPDIYAWLKEGVGSICHQYICAFFNMWNWFGVMVLHVPLVDWPGVHLPSIYMCIICHQYICAFSYMWNLCGVMVLHAAMVDWGSICLQYICGLSYVWNLCGVMVLHAAMVDCKGASAFGIYVHSPICETY